MAATDYTTEELQGYRPHMTEDEFKNWALQTELLRVEWVNGEVIVFSPSTFNHADIVGWLACLMVFHASKYNLGKVLGTNYMHRLPNRRRLPDLFFVTADRESIIKKTYLEGPADLIVEVVSPDSQTRDRREKFLEYEANGVREYWIIDPISRQAEFYLLQDPSYVPIQTPEGIIHSATLTGFWLKIEWLWQQPLPNEYEIAKTLGIIPN